MPKLRMTTCDMRRAAHCPKECLNRSDETRLVQLHPKSMPLTRNAFSPRLTPELSRTAARNGGVVHVTMQPSREAVSA